MTAYTAVSGSETVHFLILNSLILLCSFILDLIVGDPEWLPHPVRLIGKAINLLDRHLYRDTDENRTKFLKGLLLTLAITASTGLISTLLLYICFSINKYLGFALSIVMSTYCLAAHDLKKSALGVYEKIVSGDLPGARKAVGMIVGRDTGNLSEQGVIKAAIESVSESLSDGVIAPAFFIFLLGPIGGLVYKSVNTLDSMVGYKNDRYLYFGRASARLDDICNYIPSRLSALLVIISSPLVKCDFAHAVIIWKRDRLKHSSPNSAQTESAMAGALGIQLGGPASYFGKIVKKPYLGDIKHDIIAGDIKKACQVMYTASLLFVMLSLIISFVVYTCAFFI